MVATGLSSPKSWQFTAWEGLEKTFSPTRDGMVHSAWWVLILPNKAALKTMRSNRLYETDSFRCTFQAVNCQATIIKFLRDSNTSP
jgi:hypothetical protein